jgi:hypothetical protein
VPEVGDAGIEPLGQLVAAGCAIEEGSEDGVAEGQGWPPEGEADFQNASALLLYSKIIL